MSDDKKVIFSMSGVNKTYQSTNKQVLKNIYLRTKRTATADTDDLKLQIAHSATCTGNSDYVFKFRRLI